MVLAKKYGAGHGITLFVSTADPARPVVLLMLRCVVLRRVGRVVLCCVWWPQIFTSSSGRAIEEGGSLHTEDRCATQAGSSAGAPQGQKTPIALSEIFGPEKDGGPP